MTPQCACLFVCLFVCMILGITHRVFFLKSSKRLFPTNGRSIVSSVRYKLNLFPVTSINFLLGSISIRFCYDCDV